MRLERFLLGFTLVTMPFFLGGARPWIWPIIAAIFFPGVIILLWRNALADIFGGISKPWLIAIGALLIYPLLQVMPLPASWLGLISPKRLMWLQEAKQVTGLPVWIGSISYSPLETVFEGFLWWLFLLVFALVLNKVLREEKRLDWLFNLLFVFAGFEAFYGLLQVLIPSLGVLWEARGEGLARGTFVNRNHYACFLGMLWPVLLAYVFGLGIKDYGLSSRSSRPGEKRTFPERERLSQIRQKQIFFGFVIGLMILGIFFSRSRGGILGSLISLTVLIAVAKAMRTRGMLLAALGCWAVMLFYGGIIGFDEIIRRFNEIEIGSIGRFNIWETALRIISDHPRAGTGLGSFGDLFRVYQGYLDDIHTTDFAHNDYLHLMVELGVPAALFLFVPAWGYWWKTAWRITGGQRTEDKGQRAGNQRGIRHPASAIRNQISDTRHLVSAGALAGSAAFLCHGWVEFNWQIPANALYFVMLLVLMSDRPAEA